MTTTTMTRRAVEDALWKGGVHFDRIGQSKGVGGAETPHFTARRSFFYTCGETAEKLAESIRQAIPSAIILSAEKNWHAWPAESYWMIRFTA